VSPTDIDDFVRESLSDNKLVALELKCGQNLSPQTVIQLAGQAQALYAMLSLQGGSLELVQEHRILWQKAAQFFEDVIGIWESVRANGEELLDAHRQLLAELLELSRDRVEFYSVTESDRRGYKQHKLLVDKFARQHAGASTFLIFEEILSLVRHL
jgi:hypothetical protein